MTATTTSINTMLNSRNRWRQRDVTESAVLGDLVLKTPQRRPSLYFEEQERDDDSQTLSTSPIGDSISTIDFDDFDQSLNILSFMESAYSSELRPSRSIPLSGHRSDSYLFVSQLAAPENKHLRRNIRFASSVNEREYAITIGDNPSCSGPYALSLDWEHTESRRVSYNDLQTRRTRPVRQLPLNERRRRLQHLDSLSADELRLLELQAVSEKVESLQKELHDLSIDCKTRTKWPRAIQPKPITM